MVFLLKRKSDVCISLKLFMHYVRTQLGRNVKVLRSHNGTDFANSVCTALFKELGIIHESSCPYTYQNGVVYRKNRHILEVTRAQKLYAHIPFKFWGALCLSCSLSNQQITK